MLIPGCVPGIENKKKLEGIATHLVTAARTNEQPWRQAWSIKKENKG